MDIKTKNITLLIGFSILLVFGYFFAIEDTLQLRTNYISLKKQESLFTELPKKMQTLIRKEYYYDSLLTHYKISETSLQNNLLKKINFFSKENNVQVIHFNAPHQFESYDKIVVSYEFKVEGDFGAILNLAYDLEQRSKFGRVATLHFEKIKNYRSRKERLEANFILQLIQ